MGANLVHAYSVNAQNLLYITEAFKLVIGAVARAEKGEGYSQIPTMEQKGKNGKFSQ